MKKTVIISICLCVLMILTSCDSTDQESYVINKRIITVDVPNLLFQIYNSDLPYQDRGISARETVITVETDQGSYSHSISSADVAANGENDKYLYTQVQIADVEGVLHGVSVSVSSDQTDNSFTSNLSGWSNTGLFNGWTAFQNMTKFVIILETSAESIDVSSLHIEPGPRGGVSLHLAYDSGKADLYTGVTDRKDGLETLEIALEPKWLENPTGLTFDLYALVIDTNIASEYNIQINPEAAYYSDLWNAGWSCDEIMNTGRSVGGTNYKLKLLEEDLDAADPGKDGKKSFHLKLSDYQSVLNITTSPVGKYLLLGGIVRSKGELVCTSTEVVVIEIR